VDDEEVRIDCWVFETEKMWPTRLMIIFMSLYNKNNLMVWSSACETCEKIRFIFVLLFLSPKLSKKPVFKICKISKILNKYLVPAGMSTSNTGYIIIIICSAIPTLLFEHRLASLACQYQRYDNIQYHCQRLEDIVVNP
jgi:hypothetical protein